MRHVEAAAFIDYADVKPVAGSLNAHGHDIRSGVLAGVRHGFLANAIGLRFQCAIEAGQGELAFEADGGAIGFL